jgi:hypothetical protein
MPIEIDADAGLSIATQGAGNRQQFADAFHEVWESIPQADRDVMTAYWEVGTPLQENSPVVELLANYDRPGNNDFFGNTLYFNAGVADLLAAADLLHSLIAHELGHVFCYGSQTVAHTAHPANVPAKEDEADAKAEEWGYDMEALRDWTNDHAAEMAGCGVHIPAGGRW